MEEGEGSTRSWSYAARWVPACLISLAISPGGSNSQQGPGHEVDSHARLLSYIAGITERSADVCWSAVWATPPCAG